MAPPAATSQLELFAPDASAPRTSSPVREAPPRRTGEEHEAATGRAYHEAATEALRARLGPGFRVQLTDNRRVVLSVQRRGDERIVRVQRLFADAPPPVLDAVARYATRGDRLAALVLDRYVAVHRAALEHAARAPSVAGGGARAPRRGAARGRAHDLEELQRELVARYFDPPFTLAVEWGARRRGAPSRRSLRLGSYHHERGLVRLHPALDHPSVPRFVVAWVLYHELLHHAVPPLRAGGRAVHHPPEFRRREALFAERAAALAWERANLRALLLASATW